MADLKSGIEETLKTQRVKSEKIYNKIWAYDK